MNAIYLLSSAFRRTAVDAPATDVDGARAGVTTRERASAARSADHRPHGRRRDSLLVFAIVVSIYLVSPNVVSADSLRSVFVGLAMLRHGNLDIHSFSPSWTMGSMFGIVDNHGAWLPFFPWGPSLFAVPVLAAADVAFRLTGHGTIETHLAQSQSTWAYELTSMSVVGALAAVVVYRLAYVRLAALSSSRRRAAAVVVALVFALGTSAYSTGSRSLWQHGPAVLFLCLALLAASRIAANEADVRRPGMILGAAAAASFVMRPTMALVVAVLGVWLLVRHRKAIGWALLGGLPVAAVFVAVNLSQYGVLLPPYYDPFSAGKGLEGQRDLGQALLANMVSPARGLLVFSPVFLLVVMTAWLRVRQRRAEGLEVACVVLVLCQWFVVSDYPHWWAGYAYGPRFMSDTVPPLVLLSLPAVQWLAQRRLTYSSVPVVVAQALAVLLVAVSVAANAEGAWFTSTWCWNSSVAIDQHPDRVWNWSHAQVTAGIRGLLANGWSAETKRAGAELVGCQASSP